MYRFLRTELNHLRGNSIRINYILGYLKNVSPKNLKYLYEEQDLDSVFFSGHRDVNFNIHHFPTSDVDFGYAEIKKKRECRKG